MEICFLDDSNVVFKVPNISIKESIISRFSELLKEALHMVTNHDLNMTIILDGEEKGQIGAKHLRDSYPKLFDEINKMGTTIVMVTHSEKIVNDMKKRVIQLENGSIVRDEKEGVYNLGV